MSQVSVGLVDRETDFVQSLQRGLAVIRAFDADNPTLTLSDVARSTGLPRAAARRFLLTLVDLGYIRVDGRQFRLSPQVLELGRAYLSSLRLPAIALPHLRELTNELRESSSLAVLDGTDIVYVAHAPAKRILSISITIGTRDVAFATSLGRVLLAGQTDDWLDTYLATIELPPITPRTINTPDKLRTELHRIRRQGWALVDQELEDGLRAIATPIHDEHGNVIAAANLAVHASRWSNDAIRTTLLPRLLHTTHEIEGSETPAAASSGRVIGEDQVSVGLVDRETDFVQSLQRGLAVIRAFDADNPTLTLSDVARSTGLPRAAARRFLLTLVDLGYIRVDGRQFRLSPQVLELGRPYLSSLTLPEIALPHLRELTNELRESSSLAVLDGTDIVYVAHAPAKRILSISITIGTRDVAFATSLGRVLLAGQTDDWLDTYLATIELPPITPRTINTPDKLRTELHRIRRQGWALVDQELEDGLRAIATPIHDEHGNVIAAANLAVHASRWSNDAIRTTLLPRLLHTTHEIDRDTNASTLPCADGQHGSG